MDRGLSYHELVRAVRRRRSHVLARVKAAQRGLPVEQARPDGPLAHPRRRSPSANRPGKLCWGQREGGPMNERELEQHLSQIATQWTMLYQAHRGAEDEAARARQLLMQRYCGAVYRYLLRAVRDPSVAEDLTQEFALRFIQGRFGQVDREQGRFRNYVKGALFRLVQDHYRSLGRGPKALPLKDGADVLAPDEAEASEQAFHDSWRQELLSRAWRALEQAQAQAGQPYHDLLRLRVDQPDLSSTQLAEILGARLGRTLSSANVRQLVHRARERFAELLLEDVRTSLEGAPLEQVEEELAELNLLKYCKDLLDRRRG
jgi:RNA polymerase sigma-70 factor (ECF subfamily)